MERGRIKVKDDDEDNKEKRNKTVLERDARMLKEAEEIKKGRSKMKGNWRQRHNGGRT